MMARLRARETRLASLPRVTLRPLLEGRAEGGGHPQDHLGGQVDVADAGDAGFVEQRAGAPALPDDRLGDDRSGFDRLIGIYLYIRLKDGVVADVGVVAHDHPVLDPATLLDVGAAPDHAAAQAGPGPDVGVVVDDRPVQEGVALHDHARADHGVLAQAGARLDLGEVADEHGGGQDGVGVDLGPLPQPDPGPDLEPAQVDLDLAVEDVLVGSLVGLQAADVLPVAVGHEAEQRRALGEQLGEHVGGEVGRLAVRDVLEHLRLEHVDAGVDGVGEDLAPVGLLQEPLDAAVLFCDDDAELERVGHPLEDHGGHGAAAAVEADHLVEVDVGEGVPGDDHEGLAQHLGGVADAAGRAQGGRLGGVGQVDVHVGAVAEVVADLAGQELDRDHDVLEPVVADVPDDVLHDRPVAHREHGLGLVGGEGPQAGAFPAGHDHRLHRPLPQGPRGWVRETFVAMGMWFLVSSAPCLGRAGLRGDRPDGVAGAREPGPGSWVQADSAGGPAPVIPLGAVPRPVAELFQDHSDVDRPGEVVHHHPGPEQQPARSPGRRRPRPPRSPPG